MCSTILSPVSGLKTTTLSRTQTQTKTLLTTTTVIDANSSNLVSTTPSPPSETLISSSTTFVTTVDNSTITSTQVVVSTSTLATSAMTSNTTSITSGSVSTSTTTSTSTNTTLPSTGAIFTISQSALRRWLNLTSSNVNMVPSWTSVPYYILTQSKSTIGLLYLTTDVAYNSCYGYNGPIGTLVLVNTTGFIKALSVYSIIDSWGYKITQSWVNTYVGRSVFEPLILGQDAQPVTGATYSSTGVIDGVRDAGRIVVNDYQKQLNTNQSRSGTAFVLGAVLNVFGSIETSSFQTQASLFALVCLFAAAVIAFELKSDKIKYGVWVGSIVFIGFFAVRMVTMGDFVDFTSLIFPPFWRNIYWYVLYGGVLVTSLIWGRFYCGYLCPFGSFTDFLNKLSPVKLKIPIKYRIEASLLTSTWCLRSSSLKYSKRLSSIRSSPSEHSFSSMGTPLHGYSSDQYSASPSSSTDSTASTSAQQEPEWHFSAGLG